MKQKGVKIINTDRIYHDLLKNSDSMRNAIQARFDTLDTKKLGKLVFADQQAMRDLEGITHPFVIDEIKTQINERAVDDDIVVIEAIALFDSDLAQLCESIIFITADRKMLLDRITVRDGVSREYAEARLNNRDFNGNAAFIIHNNADLLSLYSQIDGIYKELAT
jgi:dephospho-CoA kinase